MDVLEIAFTHGIAFAMMGSIAGSIYSAVTQANSWRRALIEIAIGMIAAAAVAERYLPSVGVWQCGIVGLVVGLATGYALDSFTAIAPKAVREAVEAVAQRVVGKSKGG